ncbi:furin-like protease 1, isoforms 1/1-X/2 isoform X2 [Folsomia candida]|uniref:furin-like protease 1, isoforms 1/1-X/2 isoform X2 n=1 Tax=Folsomia candida TaxID=158441 RepID=UPI000B8FE25E|nr:furin-like protease 1, isoforms 1/1-X/2 isoform X2 [Folsomia candida]
MGPSSLRHEGGSRAKKRTIHAENGSCFNKRRINTWTTAAATTTRLPISICGVLVIFVILVSCQLRIVETSSINVNNLNRDFDRVATAAGGGEQDGEVAEETDSFDDDNDDLQLNLIGNGAGLEEQDQDRQHYTHQWAVHIVGGKSVADRIARKHGFINGGEIFPDYYHLVHRKVAKRSLDAHAQVHGRLIREPTVRWAEQQKVKRRSKRDFLQLSLPTGSGGRGGGERGKSRSARRSKTFNFNDPRWIGQWYLNRGAGLDMNVIEAWNEGITGKGIVVTILDDGLEHDHPDIKSNFDPMASFDVNSLDMDPMPTYDLTDSNRHGTRCAGEVAAEANNSICAVGIAFEANIGGVRMLDGDVTDAVEARSLSHNPQHIDIYSASWGPDDDGKTVDGPGELATRAFMEGVAKGRNGKGSIFVWASGNGGRDHDNCNCDGYTNSIWTLSISSATENGLVPWYSEACSSTLATTYSSGGTGEKQIITIDLHHSCTQSHTGTSASAPLAAGICALALQANTNLTWRDMQHIVVRTARPNNLIAPDWSTNGVGLNVSHSFGYGLMDAGAMVKLSRKWKPVPEQNKCEIKAKQLDKNIPAKSKVTLELKVTDCPGVRFLEHVQAKVTLMSGRRGDLQIYLVSPSGTRSVLLAHRRHDLNRSGFTDWPFMTVHSWGETPLGKWTLEIHNEGRYTDHKNGRTVLKRWSLISYGTEEDVNSGDYSSSETDLSRSRSKPASFPNSPQTPAFSFPLNFSSSDTQKFPTKNIITKTTSANKELDGLQTSDSGHTYSSNVTTSGSSGETSISNRKPSRQRQNKGKNVSKKQKVAASVPPFSKTLESHVIIASDDEDFKRLLKLKFNLNQNQSGVSSDDISRADVSNSNFTNQTTASSPYLSLQNASYSSPSPLKTEQNRSVQEERFVNATDVHAMEEKSTTLANVNQSQNITGKLQTWSLIAHGIEGNPNDPEEKANGNVSKSTDTGSKRPTSDNDASSSTNISSSKPPANDDFDGSDNSIAVPLNHVHNSPLPANSEMAADSSLSILSTSVASSPSSSACAKMSDQNGKCLECSLGLALFNGICQPSCPDGYVSQGHSREDVGPAALLTYICVQCHYTCKTCIGPSAYECRTCYEDSSLANVENFGQLCYTSQWLSYMSEAVIWFKLLIGSLVVNVIVIIILIYCICSRRNNRASGIVGRTHSTGESQRQWERDNQIYTRISPDDNNLSEDEFENLEIESETEEFSTNDVEMRIGKKFLVAEETKHDDGLLIKNKNYKANIKTFKVALSPSQIVSNVSSKTISEDSIKLVKDDDENS